MNYAEAEDKALAECERAIAMARVGNLDGDTDRVRTGRGVAAPVPRVAEANARAVFGLTVAVLAVAERLDVLIGHLFDEASPISVRDAGGDERG